MKSPRVPLTRFEWTVAVLAAVSIFGYTYFGVRWLLAPPVIGWSSQAGRILLLERIGLSALGALALVLLLRAMKKSGGAKSWVRQHAHALASFAILFLAGAALLAILNPGVVDEDFFYSVHMARSGAFSDWYSYIQPLLTQVVGMMLPFPAGFALANMAALAAVMAAYYATAVHRGANPWLAAGLLLACTLSIPTWFSAIQPTRDSWFTWLFLAWLLLAWRDLLRGKGLSGTGMPLHIGAATLLSLYRPDALPGAMLLITILGARAGARRLPRALLGTCSFVIVFLIASVTLPSVLKALNPDVHSRHSEYMLTLVVNPLGHLLQQGYRPHDPATDEVILGRVIDLDQARKVSYARNIPVIYQGHWNQSSTLDERRAFRDRSLLLFAENPSLFLESRWRTFAIAAGLQEGRTATYYKREAAQGKFPWPTPAISSFPDAERRIWTTIDRSLEFEGVSLYGKFAHWNLIPGLLACIGLLLFWSWIPATATLALVVLVRTGVVFLAEPASFFQYHLALYLAPFLLIPLAAAEWRHSKGGVRSWFPGEGGVQSTRTD